jgi:hypothetical protein
MIKKILHILGWVVIFGNLALIGLVAWWLLHPYGLPQITQPMPIENENNEIAIGEHIRMTMEVTKPRDMTPSVSVKNLTCNDGNLVTLAGGITPIPTGSYTVHSSNYILPPKVAKGSTCRFNFVNTYKLNPLRSETITYSSEDFKVKE